MDEWIIERGRSADLRRPRVRFLPPTRTFLLVLSMLVVTLPAASDGRKGAMPGFDPSTRPSPAATASPAASPAAPAPSSLRGTGPFVIFGLREGESVDVLAVDAGAPGEARRPLFLGRIPNWSHASPDRGGARGAALVLGDAVYLVARGEKLGTRVIRTNRFVQAAAVSPDGRHVAVASMTPDGVAESEVVIYSTRNVASRRSVFRARTGADQSGGALHLFWTGPDRLILIDECHCDGGPGYAVTYGISTDGRVEKLQFLEDHIADDPGVQRGTARFVFDDIPPVDCFESETACDNLLHSLTVADARSHSLHVIATRRNEKFAYPVVSADGDWVATTRYGVAQIEIRPVRVKAPPARIWYQAAELRPVVWIDHERLVLLAASPDYSSDRTTGRLLLVRPDGHGWAEPETLTSGVDLEYLGWLA